jgi:hypothetical protein
MLLSSSFGSCCQQHVFLPPSCRVGRSKDGLLLSLAGAAGAIQGELAVWRWCCQEWMSCCPCSGVSAHSAALEMLLVRWTVAAHATVQQRFCPLQVLPEAARAEGVVQGAVLQVTCMCCIVLEGGTRKGRLEGEVLHMLAGLLLLPFTCCKLLSSSLLSLERGELMSAVQVSGCL